MPVPPFAIKKLIAPGTSDPRIDVIHGVILHVDAGNATSLYDFFKNRSGGLESHCHVRKDGTVEWYRDTDYEADANYKANSFMVSNKRHGYLSVETQGKEAGEWTDAQIASIKKIIDWAHDTHGVPFKVCESTTGRGIGYHTLFGSPSAWTPVAKSCPGPDRKEQFSNVIKPWLAARAKATAAPAKADANRAASIKSIRAARKELKESRADLRKAKAKTSATSARGKRVRAGLRSINAALAALRTPKKK